MWQGRRGAVLKSDHGQAALLSHSRVETQVSSPATREHRKDCSPHSEQPPREALELLLRNPHTRGLKLSSTSDVLD